MKKWCICDTLHAVVRYGHSTCSKCGGQDAYGMSRNCPDYQQKNTHGYKKVFLGGTCNDSTWRDELIPMLKIDYFNPVVDDWTLECQKEELKQRQECDYCLYVITPNITGVYSIAEVIDDSNKRPNKTIFCMLPEAIKKQKPRIWPFPNEPEMKIIKLAFSEGQMKSLNSVGDMVKRNGGHFLKSLNEIANFLNLINK